MKFIAVSLLALLLTGCSMSTKQVVNDVKDGVVLITNELPNNGGGIGTGFIVGENQIVTNLHVVDGEGIVHVYDNGSQRKYKAVILHKDPVADLVVLQLFDWDSFVQNEHPEILSLGNSDNAEVGEKIIVIGHPWGLYWTVSEGIVSAKGRRIDQNPKFLDQVDAKLYQGNSGGPIFDEAGNVVCVSNMMLAKEGGSYGFCIPSNLVKKVLYDFSVFGEVRWRVMNVSASMTEDGANVIIKELDPDGAASKAGLQINDKILMLNDIEVRNPDDLISGMAVLKGDTENVKLLIDRNGEKLMIDVKTNHKLSKEY